jgi:hypothetical protein
MQKTSGGSKSGGDYHCDLRLDNILVSRSSVDILLFDFDHYGMLTNSAAPEVGCMISL